MMLYSKSKQVSKSYTNTPTNNEYLNILFRLFHIFYNIVVNKYSHKKSRSFLM